MEASGANAKVIEVRIPFNGQTMRPVVTSDADRIEIGGLMSFNRAEFLLAIGLCEADLDRIHG